MGQMITLTAADGHQLGAYRADPHGAYTGQPKGGVVVIQEIFGVNDHIRDVCDRFAEVGYLALAPALYDRFERDFQSGYSDEEIVRGRDLKAKGNDNIEGVMADVEAARLVAAEAGKVGITGYCWGGVVTWVASCRGQFQAASSYYGGGILPYLDEQPNCPLEAHFGRQDASIPMDDVEQIIAADHPGVDIHVYEAGHGFNCDKRGSFDPHAAQVAAFRTMRLFDQHLA